VRIIIKKENFLHLSVGKVNIDISVFSGDRPKKGERVNAKIIISLGGAACNYAAFVSYLGHRSALVAKISEDFRDYILSEMTKKGIETKYLIISKGEQSVNVIFVDEDGERSMYSNPGMAETLSISDYKNIEDVTVIHFASVKPSIITKVNARLITYDPGPYVDLINEEVIKKVDILYLNKSEFMKVNKIIGENKVIIKKGEEGAEAMIRGERCIARAPKVNVKDTTGAGDIFDASMNYSLIEGKSVGESLAFSVALASLKTELPGAQNFPDKNYAIKMISNGDVKLECK